MLSILSKSYVGLMLYALLRNEVQLYMEELSDSLHLSNDKNKSKKQAEVQRILKHELLLYLITPYKINGHYQKLINII